MREFNKFRAITVGFILMFIFAVAAMYTNTKEAAENKMKSKHQINIEQNKDAFKQISEKESAAKTDENSTQEQLQRLTERVDNLEKNVFAPGNNEPQQDLKCTIRGIVNDGVIVPLSAQESITNAKDNGKEIVITCNLY